MAKDKVVATNPDELAKIRAQKLAGGPGGPGMSAASIGQFFKETWIELKKTTWPDQNTLTKSTMIVLAFIFAAAVWVGFIDNLLTTLTKNLINH